MKRLIIYDGFGGFKKPGETLPGMDVTRHILDTLVELGVLSTTDCCHYTFAGDSTPDTTTNVISYNPVTNVVTSTVNGVASSTTITFNTGQVTTIGPITIGGVTYTAGTTLQTVLNAIIGLSHVPVTVVDSPTINFTPSGTDNQTITADVILNPDPTNLATITPTGIMVTPQVVHVPAVINDTDTITATASGTDNQTFDLEVKLDTTVPNLITSSANGLLVSPVPTNTHEVQAVSYTGIEFPLTAGVTVGDTVTLSFDNGTGFYTFDGTNWVLDFFTPQTLPLDTTVLCDPTGVPVLVINTNGVFTYQNPDNTPYTGDVTLLENCCCASTVTAPSLTYNNDNSYTYNPNDGNPSTTFFTVPAPTVIFNSDFDAGVAGIPLEGFYWTGPSHIELTEGVLKKRIV